MKMSMFQWYRVEQSTGVMKIPGGWLVRYQATEPPMVFIPDPDHDGEFHWVEGVREFDRDRD